MVHKVDGSRARERISRNITEDDLSSDFSFLVAKKLSDTLLGKGLITQEQYKILMNANARSFPGALSSLYQLKTCYIDI